MCQMIKSALSRLLCRKANLKLVLAVFCLLSVLVYLRNASSASLKSRDAHETDEIDQVLEFSDQLIISEYRDRLARGEVVTPPNSEFIFHNKLPKCASTTLNYVLLGLAKKNGFNYEKINSGSKSFAASIQEEAPVLSYVENNFKPPFLLLKHQFWVNFTSLTPEMRPTYINLIRDPLDWITSRYYFSRYGWKRDPGCRGEGCSMSREEHSMSIDECVEQRLPLCTTPSPYFPYLCGPSNECFLERKDLVYETTRKRLIDEYFFVGILEHFEETLRALELLLPRYFRGAVEIWKSAKIQRRQGLTRTEKKKEMNKETKLYYLNGPLKYEAKFYNFAKRVFAERLKTLGIPLESS